MVAVVSGGGLGLFGSSAAILGGVHGNASLGRGTDRVYVNSATGNLIVQSRDENLAGLGLDVALVRTYNSQGLMDDDNGDNWRLGIHQRLYGWTGTPNSAGSTVTKVFGDGSEVVYRYDAGLGAYVSNEGDGAHDTITYGGGQWTWQDGSTRNSETYDANGRLLSAADADGNVVTYVYENNLLRQILDSSGQQTFLDYIGTDLAAIRVVSNGQTQTLTRYYYDGQHRLQQVIVDLTPTDNVAPLVDSNGDGLFETVDDQTYVTTYAYDGQSKRIASITQSDGTSIGFTYEQVVAGEYRVKTYSMNPGGGAAPRVTTLNYSGGGMTAEESVLSNTGTVITNYPLNPTLFPPNWSPAALLESDGVHAISPQIVFDSLGNGVAVWAQGSDVYARRYTAATNTWGPLTTLDNSSLQAYAPALGIDPTTGEAIAAWSHSDGVTSQLAMSRFDAATNTWSAAVEVASWEGVPLETTHLSVDVSGHYAAVAWAQGTTSNRELFQVIYKHGLSLGQEILEFSGEPVDQVQVQIDANGNALTLWRQSDAISQRTYFNRWRDATQSYSGPTLLDNLVDGGSWPQLKFDAQGNAFAAWAQWNGLQVRRFDVVTNSWGPAEAVQTTPDDYWDWDLAVDEQGNAIVAWTAGDWFAPTLHARVFDPATNSWGDTAALDTPPGVYRDDRISVSISGSNAVVAWLQSNGTGNDVYAARLSGGTWSSPALLETRPEEPRSLSTAIDAHGRINVLWVQADGFARSIYQARFDNSGHTYTVPSGATWQSIASTLYGVNSVEAGEALRTALGNPPLTAGTQLTDLPPTLGVSQTTTVPPYYTVQAGDTWTSITQAIYGTSDPFVVEELQELLDDAPLVAGTRLTVPLVLNSMRTHVQDPLGNVTTYIKDSTGRLVAILRPEADGVRLQTRYDYDRDGNVMAITEDPRGNNRTTEFEYDERGNLVTTRDPAGNTVTRTYDANNQLLSETRYVVPDADGMGPVQPSEPLTTRYVYDSENHLRFVVSADRRVTEHRYNGAGQRVTTLHYTHSFYYNNDPATESDMVLWTTRQSSLERTDYSYDFRGNVETVVVWSDPDSSGAGGGTASVTRFVYDQRGQLLRTFDPRGELTSDANDFATTFTYDGLGRLLTTSQWVSNGETRVSINDYDDADHRLVTTLENGANTLVTTSLYNGFGELISVTSSSGAGALGTTTYKYDAAGRLRITIDPVGVRTFIVYDALGRKVGMVDGDGSLTQYIYNATGQIVKTVQYADRLSAAEIATLTTAGGEPVEEVYISWLVGSLAAVPGRDPTQDRITRSVFDPAGRLAYTIDDVGAVVGFEYDGAGRLIRQVAYANVLSVHRDWDELDWRLELTPDPLHDRTQRNFYDGDGNLLGTLDAAGYLVEYRYDVAGRVIEQIAYATPTNSALRELGSLDDLRPALDNTEEPSSPERDIRSRFYYDGRGRRIGVLDAEGFFTETFYGTSEANMDLVLLVIRYARKLTYDGGATLAQIKSQIQWTDVSRSTHYRYNGAGQVLKESIDFGTELAHSTTATEYAYDMAGRLVRTTRALGTDNERTTRVRYDALGRVTQELTPEGTVRIAEGLPVEQAWDQYSVRHAYDDAGHRISTTDQNQKRTVFYYDDDGRLAYTVNAEGEVAHSKYDALGRLIETIVYDRRIGTSGLNGGRVDTDLMSRIVSNAALDSRSSISYEYIEGGSRTTTTTAEGTSIAQWVDAFGDVVRRVEVRATAAREHNYSYDQRGLLHQTQWGLERTETLEYDAFGRVQSSRDQYGNITRTEYDALGRVVATVDPINARRTTTYDAFSRQLTVTGATPGSSVSFSYDNVARSMTMTTGQAVVVTTTFNQHGDTLNVVTADDNGSTEVSYEYDANGQLTRVFDPMPLGNRVINEYDRAGLLFRTTDGNGVITEYQYDGANRVHTKIEDVGGLNLTTRYAYYDEDTEVRLLRTTQPNGAVTETRYDRDGRVATITVDPNGPARSVTRYQYDDVDNTMTVTQGDGTPEARVTRYEYDSLGRRTAEIVDPGEGTNHLNIRTRYRYDANGNLTRKIDAEGHSTWYVYDNDGRLTFTIDALGGITETTYDPEDRIVGTRRFATATTAVAGWVANDVNRVTAADLTVQRNDSIDRYEQTLYDRDGRAVFTVNPLGAVTHRKFDANGNVIREVMFNATIGVGTYADADAVATALANQQVDLTSPGSEDRVRWTTYDNRNRAVYSVDGLGTVTKNEYDGADNVTRIIAYATQDASVTPANVAEWAATHTSVNDRTTRYWYDGANRPRFKLDAEGWLTETRYLDATRERKAIVYTNQPGTNGAPSVPANADLADLENLVADPELSGPLYNQETITRYDAAGRVVSVRDADHKTEYFGYDAVGNKTSYTNQKGSAAGDVAYTWRYEYDAANRLIYERSPTVAVTRVDPETLEVLETNSSIVTYNEYDALGNVKHRHEAHGTAQVRTTSYEYDALGRQTATLSPTVGIYETAGDTQFGNGTAVTREQHETQTRIVSETAYDVFGNAFRNRLVREDQRAPAPNGTLAGTFTYKAYDNLGRVCYDTDAKNQVTGYTYDAFGNKTVVTRYATPIAAPSPTGTSLMASAVTPNMDIGADRTITTTFDRLNREISVRQLSVRNFVPTPNGTGGSYYDAEPTTEYVYNAFGEVIRASTRVNATEWAHTYSYYDRRGNKVAELDPSGYLTRFFYDDASGDLTSKIEYARPTTGAVDYNSYGTIVTTTKSNAPIGSDESFEGYDRETSYAYDKLNRKISETRHNLEYTSIDDYGVLTTAYDGSQTTHYGYDALGNLTKVSDTTGATTYSFYDVLGRIIAVAEPARDLGGQATQLIAYKRMLRDAHGNLVQQIEHYNGLAADVFGATPPDAPALPVGPAAHANDRTTTIVVDAQGNALRTRDANGADRYASYNIRGDIAKEWQVVVNPNVSNSPSDDITETIVKLYRYDAVGQTTEVIESQRYNENASTETVTRVAEYNAFGEIIYKYNSGTAFDEREYYDYDRAGRVWRTNSGDGVDKVFMYDLAGNATLELRSRSENLNLGRTASSLGTYTSAQSVVTDLSSALMRTETVYDKKGNVVERRMPQFDVAAGFPPVAPDISIGTFSGTPYVYWTPPPSYSGVTTFWYRVAGSGAAYSSLTIDTSLPGGFAGANVNGLTGQTYEFRIATTFAGELMPTAESVGTFLIDGAGNATLTNAAQRADTTLPFTPGFGSTLVVDPPYAVYHRISTPGGYAYVLGALPASEGGGYYYVQPGVYNLAANYFYGERLAISIPRPATNGILATVEFWSSATPSLVQTANVSATSAEWWKADIEGASGIADGTYGYRITLRRSGSLTPLGVQEGTFEVGGTNSLTVGPSSSTASTVATPTTHQKLDRWGNVINVKDAANNVTRYRYNGFDQLVQTREAQDFVYDRRDAAGEKSIFGILTQVEKTNHYDILGRLIEAQDGYDQASRASYNSAGQLLTKRNADYARHTNGATSYNVYDLFGNLIQKQDELGYLTRYKYDGLGRLVAEWREIELNTFTDRLDATSTAVNSTANVQTLSYAYDQAGRRVSETNGENETIRYRYDLLGNLTQVRTNLGHVTSYVYNADGKRTHETDALGSTKSWIYDAFGKLTSHTELNNTNNLIGANGGTEITYHYNHAGQILTQTSTAGQNISYHYDRGGNLSSIDDAAVNRRTSYQYDSAGRQARETVVVDSRLHQDTRITYDNHNRIKGLDDPDYSERILYDVNGQRAHVGATYPDHQWKVLQETLSYQYDEMGRITQQTTYSQDQGRNFITDFEYNSRGDRVLQTAPGQPWEPHNDSYHNEYNFVARIDELYDYDGLGRLKTVNRNTWHNDTPPNNPIEILIRSYTYDLANRRLTEMNATIEGATIDSERLITRNTTTSYDGDGRTISQTTYRAGVRESIVNYGSAELINGSWTLGYDAANNLRGYEVLFHNSSGSHTSTTTYENKYYLFEGYTDRQQVANSSGDGAPRMGETNRSYNANHELISFTDNHAEPARTRYFVNNQAGQMLTSIQPWQADLSEVWNTAVQRAQVGGAYNKAGAQYFFYAQGNFIGQLGQAREGEAFQGRFDVNATPISANYPSATPSTVIAQAGDTLRTLAARVFGDATLWYILAEENGYTNPDAHIDDGTQLRVPNDVISLSNTSSSFKPFNITDALGDTTPTQPPPPQAKGGCGVLGLVLIAVVAIVVTVFTAGVAAGGVGSAAGVFSTGASALAGGAVGGLGAVGASIVGGAVGSAVSQGVAIAAGMQEGFDWKGVAIGAIGAGVTSGLGAAGTAAAQAGRQGFAASVGKFLNTFGEAGTWTRAAANAAISSTLTQGIAVATGVQSSFSWRNVAISAAAAPVAQQAARFTPTSLGSFGQQFAGGIAGSYVRRAFGGKIDTATILADAFGNALGSSIVEGMSPQPTTQSRASGGSPGELEEVQITARYIGPEAESRNARLSNDPINIVRSGSDLSLDELHSFGSVTIEAPRIREGEDAGLDQWFFLNQFYRPHLSAEGQDVVDEARYAAEANYRSLADKGRYNLGALNTLGNAHDLITGASAGTGAADLAFRYKGGPAGLTEQILGGTVGLAGGVLEGLFRGTAGAADFTLDVTGALLYESGGGEFFAPAYERYGATAAGLVDLASNPKATFGAVGDYFSRVGNLYGVDPLNAGSLLGKPLGEAVAPGVELLSAAKGLRAAGSEAVVLGGRLSSKIDELAKFRPKGIVGADADAFLATSTGQEMLRAMRAADPRSSNDVIVARALEWVQSGSTLPVREMISTPLVKIIPRGGAPLTPYSPFFTTQAELNRVAASGRSLADAFGLPVQSHGSFYDVYEIAPRQPTPVFRSTIAPTTERGGLVRTTGGAQQYLVPNRSLFTTPRWVGGIYD